VIPRGTVYPPAHFVRRAVATLVRVVPCAAPPRLHGPSRVSTLAWDLVPASVVLGIPTLLFVGLVVGTAHRGHGFYESKGDVASATVKKYAYEAYPSWRMANPAGDCPWSLYELNQWMNNKDIRDPWGSDYEYKCIRDDRGDMRLIVRSLGDDGRRGTDDDLWSHLPNEWSDHRRQMDAAPISLAKASPSPRIENPLSGVSAESAPGKAWERRMNIEAETSR
jgi:hypothetical protein